MTPPRRLAPDRWLIELPLRGHGIGHVNVLVMADGDSLTLIDTGWGHEGVWNYLSDALEAVGARIEQVTRLVATHYHADHCGASRMFQERVGAEVVLHRSDADSIDDRYVRRDPYSAQTLQWIASVGAPPEIRDSALAMVDELGDHVLPFKPDRVIDGPAEKLPGGSGNLTLIHTPGHTAGHLCVYDADTGLLATGDSLFARINTNPVLRPQSTDDPLGDYLHSLDSLATLPARLVIPGHLEIFDDLAGRIAEIREFHRGRLEEIAGLIGDGAATAWQIASSVRRRRPWSALSAPAKTTAAAETFAHIRRLEVEGRIVRNPPDPLRWALS